MAKMTAGKFYWVFCFGAWTLGQCHSDCAKFSVIGRSHLIRPVKVGKQVAARTADARKKKAA
jgi:hypothetical protein